MGTIKASDKLRVMNFKHGSIIIQKSEPNDIFNTQKEAENWLKDLDILEHYKAHVKQLRVALQYVQDFHNGDKTRNKKTMIAIVDKALKETE